MILKNYGTFASTLLSLYQLHISYCSEVLPFLLIVAYFNRVVPSLTIQEVNTCIIAYLI